MLDPSVTQIATSAGAITCEVPFMHVRSETDRLDSFNIEHWSLPTISDNVWSEKSLRQPKTVAPDSELFSGYTTTQ